MTDCHPVILRFQYEKDLLRVNGGFYNEAFCPTLILIVLKESLEYLPTVHFYFTHIEIRSRVFFPFLPKAIHCTLRYYIGSDIRCIFQKTI